MSKEKKSGTWVATLVLLSVILTIVVVSVVNVGLGIFLEGPKYEDFCDIDLKPFPFEENLTAQEREEANAEAERCNEEYDQARKAYNQVQFYVFALIGLVLLIGGLFVDDLLFRSSGLASGGILVFEGVVTNLDDKVVVLVLLLAILGVVGWFGRKVLRK